jgi:hypothetical protein
VPIFRNSGPRLLPELDDSRLGRVLKQLSTPAAAGLTGIQVDQMERLLQEAGRDWDRRAHRFSVLAAVPNAPALARNWRMRRTRGDALLFDAWVQLLHGSSPGRPDDPRALLETCYQAADLLPDDPEPWVVCLAVMRQLRSRMPDVSAIWREITSRDPWNREAYLQMLGYLSPEECGSVAQTMDFVDSVRSRVPAGSPVSGLPLSWAVEQHHRTLSRGGVDALMARRQWTQAQTAAALDEAVAEWVKPGFLSHAAALADLNLLAYALVAASRISQAGPVFRLIGGTVTPWPWQLDGPPLERFRQCRALAQS